MWILKNSKEWLDHLKSRNFNLITNTKYFDFSTLYTSIPHQKLPHTERNSYSLCSRPVGNGLHLSSTSHIDTSMTYCPWTTQTLKYISVRCIPLSLRSKTRRRATLLFSTWIYSYLSVARDGQLCTSLYDKRDDFNFHITIFPFLSRNIRSSPAYGVFIAQLIWYARACSS